MLLTFEGWCMLQCHQIPTNKPPLDFPFSFLPALLDGYFWDMKLPLKPSETVDAPATTSVMNYSSLPKCNYLGKEASLITFSRIH